LREDCVGATTIGAYASGDAVGVAHAAAHERLPLEGKPRPEPPASAVISQVPMKGARSSLCGTIEIAYVPGTRFTVMIPAASLVVATR
jgi:hypothetical protein